MRLHKTNYSNTLKQIVHSKHQHWSTSSTRTYKLCERQEVTDIKLCNILIARSILTKLQSSLGEERLKYTDGQKKCNILRIVRNTVFSVSVPV